MMQCVALLVWLVAGMGTAGACSCFGPGPVCEIALGTATVFRGTVVDVTLEPNPTTLNLKRPDGTPLRVRGNGRYRVRFAVAETFSGAPAQERTVYTAESSSACGFPFEAGAEYVVFTYLAGDDPAFAQRAGELWVNKCSRTAKLVAGREGENESVAWMRSRAGAAAGSEVFGQVRLPRGEAEETVATRLLLEGPVRREVVSDQTGAYRAKGLPAGEYRMSARVPAGFMTSPPRTFVLGEKGCVAADWSVRYAGRVSGRVVDADGRPVADLLMHLSVAGVARDAGQLRTYTGADGGYAFEKVTPGTYTVAAERPGALTEEYPAVMYPHASEPAGAEVIELGPAATRAGVDFRQARLLPTVPVRVRVLLPDGTAAPAGMMVFADDSGARARVNRTGVTGADGWATLPLFAGRSYSLNVALDRSHAFCGGPNVRVVVTETVAPVEWRMSDAGKCLVR